MEMTPRASLCELRLSPAGFVDARRGNESACCLGNVVDLALPARHAWIRRSLDERGGPRLGVLELTGDEQPLDLAQIVKLPPHVELHHRWLVEARRLGGCRCGSSPPDAGRPQLANTIAAIDSARVTGPFHPAWRAHRGKCGGDLGRADLGAALRGAREIIH